MLKTDISNLDLGITFSTMKSVYGIDEIIDL